MMKIFRNDVVAHPDRLEVDDVRPAIGTSGGWGELEKLFKRVA